MYNTTKKVAKGRKRGPSTASGVWEAGETRWSYRERERGKKRGKGRLVEMCKKETDVYGKIKKKARDMYGNVKIGYRNE